MKYTKCSLTKRVHGSFICISQKSIQFGPYKKCTSNINKIKILGAQYFQISRYGSFTCKCFPVSASGQENLGSRLHRVEIPFGSYDFFYTLSMDCQSSSFFSKFWNPFIIFRAVPEHILKENISVTILLTELKYHTYSNWPITNLNTKINQYLRWDRFRKLDYLAWNASNSLIIFLYLL